MKSKYRLIEDVEPTEMQLKKIVSDATISVIKRAQIAEKKFNKMQKEYFAETKLKYASKIMAYATKA